MAQAVTIYDALSKENQEVVRTAAAQIATLQQRLVTDVVEIGMALVRAKRAVGHGNFGAWIKAEFNWTERTAQNFMSVAEKFGTNAKCVSYLPLATVYRLAAPSTPDEVREKIVARVEGGETVEADEIAAEITAARREVQREREEAKKSPEAKRRAESLRKRNLAERQRSAVKWEEEQERRVSSRSEAAMLIVGNLNEADFDRLLKLLEHGHIITQRDLLDVRGKVSSL